MLEHRFDSLRRHRPRQFWPPPVPSPADVLGQVGVVEDHRLLHGQLPAPAGLDRPPVHGQPDRHVHEGQPDGVEVDALVGGLPARLLPGHDLVEVGVDVAVGELPVLVHPAQGLGAVLHRLPVVADDLLALPGHRVLVLPAAHVAVEGPRLHPVGLEQGAWALVAVTRMSAPAMARAGSVPVATSSMSGTSGASSATNWRSSSAVLAATRHSVRVGRTVFMASRCILACSPLPMNPIARASGGAKCLAANAPMAPTRMLEASVPSSTAIGNPFSISDRMNSAVRFWSPNRGTLGGNTDTHLTPQTFSVSKVAGRQLMRSWVSWLKIWTIFSGNSTSPLRWASSADSAAPMAIRKSKQPA